MWYNSLEFYVISGAVAAAVVALSALPKSTQPAVLHFAAGELSHEGESEPELDVSVDDNCRLHIVRRGLRGILSDGAVSLAANARGFDIAIEERLTAGRYGEPVDTAHFVFDFLGPERYHISYNSEDAGVFAAFSLPVREGIHLSRKLQ